MTPADRSVDPGPPPPPPPASSGRRRIERSRHHIVAGVSGAVSREIGIDVRWVRAAFVVLTFLGGAGVALYGLGIFLIPLEGEDRSFAQRWLDSDDRIRLAGGVVVLLLAFGFLFGWGGWWRHGLFPGGWVLIVVGLLLLFGPRVDRDHRGGPPPAGPPTGDTTPTAPAADSASVDPTAVMADAAAGEPPHGDTTSPTASGQQPAPRRRRWRIFGATMASLVVLAFVGLLVAVTTDALPVGWGWGDHTRRPASVQELEHYRLFAGTQRIDLTQLPIDEGNTVTVKIDQRFGHVLVDVPYDARVRLDAHVRAGNINAFGVSSNGWDVDEPVKVSTPPGWKGGPTIALDVRLTAGDLSLDRGVR